MESSRGEIMAIRDAIPDDGEPRAAISASVVAIEPSMVVST
jgi:hypothetical protein